MTPFELAYPVQINIHYLHCSAVCFTCWTIIQSLRFSCKIILWKWDKNKTERRERLIWNFVIDSEILTLFVKTSDSTFSWELSRTVTNTQNLIFGIHYKLLSKTLLTTPHPKKPNQNKQKKPQQQPKTQQKPTHLILPVQFSQYGFFWFKEVI